MNRLKETIRAKAVDAFRKDLSMSICSAISRHRAIESRKCVSAKIAFIDSIVEHNRDEIGDIALLIFLSTYEHLLTEFPQFQNVGES